MVGFCIYQGIKTDLSLTSVPLIFFFLNLAIFIFAWRTGPIWTDEAEHLHCGWLVSQGLIPFKDFWQHHPPLLWVLIAPLFNLLKPSAAFFEYSRLFCIILFFLCSWMGWKIAVLVWKEKVNLFLYLLVLSAAFINGEWFYLRPDLFMTFFCLAGIYFSLLALEQGGVLPFFFAGTFFSLALSFLPKQYFVVLLPLFFILSKKENRSLTIGGYLSGLMVGCLPLILYLLKMHIFKDYLFWVFVFNSKRVTFEVAFPGAILILTVAATGYYLRHWKEQGNKQLLFILAAIFLVTLNCIPSGIFLSRGYYLQLWYILGAIICSNISLQNLLIPIKSLLNKAVLLTGIGMLFVMPNFYVLNSEGSYFKNDKEAMEKMLHYSKGGTCFALVPWHPIFVKDTTWMYLTWQFNDFIGNFDEVNSDLKRKGGLINKILQEKPAIIQATSDRGFIFGGLISRKVVSLPEFNKVKVFLGKNYSFEKIGDVFFFVRNDKVDSSGVRLDNLAKLF